MKTESEYIEEFNQMIKELENQQGFEKLIDKVFKNEELRIRFRMKLLRRVLKIINSKKIKIFK